VKLDVDRVGWALPIIGVLGTCLAIGGALTFVFGNSTVTMGGVIAFVVGAPLGLFGMAAWIHGFPYVLAEGASLHYLTSKTDRITVPFAALELSIREGTMKSRTVSHYYDLVSPQFGDGVVLFTSFDEAKVRARKALLEDLKIQAAKLPAETR
jgi:hypothetical protein